MNLLSLRDGLVNMISRLGTPRDKASGLVHTFTPYSDQELEIMYRGSALARRIVDKPAEDCAREWRDWQANKAQIEALEATEKRLRLPSRIIGAQKAKRLFGGGAVYIGVKDGALPSLPINTRALGKDCVQYLTPLSKRDIVAGDIELDPREPGFGQPIFYFLNAKDGEQIRIHPSRLVVFKGEQTPDGLHTILRNDWGDSVLQATTQDINNLEGSKANVASLIYEKKVDVIKIPDLIQNLSTRGEEYENLILQRLSISQTAKGNNGTLLLDTLEEYEQKHAELGDLPEILDRFTVAVSAAAGIPVTILFGLSPAGLNATGDADIRNYYDGVRTLQEFHLTPAMSVLDELTIISALGSRPADVHYTWRSLWQPTALEKAQVADLQAKTLNLLRTMNAISQEALQVTAVNAMVETGAFPGIEDATSEFPPEEEEPDLLTEAEAGEAPSDEEAA